MAREGDVNEGVTAQLVSGADDEVAAGDEVVIADEVSSGADLGQVFVRLTCDAEDVRAAFLDAAESLGGAGNSLVNDDGLHVGVIGEVNDGLDGGLELFSEVVGVDGQLDHILAVHCLESLGAAAVVLGLRDGTGDYADVDIAGGSSVVSCGVISLCSIGCGSSGRIVGSRLAACAQSEYHAESHEQCDKFLHVCPP